MSDLDKKLEDICYRMYENSGNSQYIRAEWANKPLHPNEAFRQIKQAFIDDGWVKPNAFGQVAYTTIHKDGKTTIVPAQPDLMTKSEWEHQAIKDGWISPQEVDKIGEQQLDFGHRWGMMTGKEWYDKFEQKLFTFSHEDASTIHVYKGTTIVNTTIRFESTDIFAAAKKAAGIE